MLEALVKEIESTSKYLDQRSLDSIYFGGGTPSLLSKDELGSIMNTLSQYYSWTKDTEITLEANPDDLNKQTIKGLTEIGINRLSIGIQSFHDKDLSFMNRAHNATEAKQCIELAQDLGINNLSIDLIYGSETTSYSMWEENINTALSLDVPHISSYCLTIEERTPLAAFVERGLAKPLDEEKAEQQFHTLINALESNGFEHYEISNFAKDEKYAVHNSNYWLGKSYLGIGPSAHSYNGLSRQWNIAHNAKYISSIERGQLPSTKENLSTSERYNEYILVRLRTKWGCQPKEVEEKFPMFYEHFKTESQKLLEGGWIDYQASEETFVLSQKGKFLADKISVDLMV